nr:MAG TPA: hypothetical protein [Caudoviricetes sp.]
MQKTCRLFFFAYLCTVTISVGLISNRNTFFTI